MPAKRKSKKTKVPSDIKVKPQLRYVMDRERFFEVWEFCLREGQYGEYMLAKLKFEFDSKQIPNDDGTVAELTWNKCKAKMNYYKTAWNLKFEQIPWNEGAATIDRKAFEKKWKAKIQAAALGGEDRRRTSKQRDPEEE